MPVITYDKNGFYRNGEKHTVISGAIHYFRVPREYWRDRLTKLRECGFNTVETYVCWNLHEKEEGKFDFSGILDLGAFLDTAAELGLDAIVRPGPYICAEWDFGGLPAWLLCYDKCELRCLDPIFMTKAKRYLTRVLSVVVPRMAEAGGNVIMLQLENEYGSYGCDKDYLSALRGIYDECGVSCLVYTADGTADYMLAGGTLPDVLPAANFGSAPEKNFAALDAFRPGLPHFCGEYWCGWFDHWYEKHHTRVADEAAETFLSMLRSGASANYYMFHGGTNFGFMNGANYTEQGYAPTVTSYDYCAPLSEAGDMTEAYYALRSAVWSFLGKTPPPLTSKNSEKRTYGRVSLDKCADIIAQAEAFTPAFRAPAAKYCEDFGQYYGFSLYTVYLEGFCAPMPLEADVLADRAVIYTDGRLAGIYERGRENTPLTVGAAAGQRVRIDILCENMGRVNYGIHLRDRKGLRGLRTGHRYLSDFTMRRIDETMPAGLARGEYTDGFVGSRAVFGSFDCPAPADTFLRLPGFTHGYVTVNGKNIGRYYNTAGPQKTLYVPAPFLRTGRNEIMIFETDGAKKGASAEFTDTPSLGEENLKVYQN